MTRPRYLASIALALAIAAPAQELSTKQRQLIQPVIDAIRQAKTAGDEARLDASIDSLLGGGRLIAAAAVPVSTIQFIIEANRLDKEVGTTSGGSGSTNLVSSGSVPRILGFAVETGAMTQSISGTSITFRTNPAGLVQALRAHGLDNEGDIATQHTLNVLERINVGLTFDTNREKDGRFTGSYRQLEQASAQIYLYNHRDPTHPAWRTVWNEFRDQLAGQSLANSMRDFNDLLNADADFKTRREQTRAALKAAAPDQVENLVLAYIRDTSLTVRDSPAAKRVVDAWTAYLQQQGNSYKRIARSPIVTVEYVLTRPPVQDAPTDVTDATPVTNQPDLSVIRLVFTRPFLGASDMTANASLSLFNQALPAMRGNIRDWQVGGKLDFPLPAIAGIAKSQLTFAGLYMNLRQQPLGVPLTVNGVPVDRTGSLGFLQARLRIPLGDSGFSVPVSFTYSTRTELIDEKEVRGNVGLTFDLDKLFAAARR